MIERRPFDKLGHADHGWLNARHHFSFANWHDPSRMGWGALRVWNDDEIAPKSGFPPHPHADMEIITYVREGAITHKECLGYVGRTVAGVVVVLWGGWGLGGPLWVSGCSGGRGSFAAASSGRRPPASRTGATAACRRSHARRVSGVSPASSAAALIGYIDRKYTVCTGDGCTVV